MPYPDAVDLGSLRFDGKLDLAIALDVLQPGQRGGYTVLNGIRNALAHNPEAFVTVGQVQELIDALDAPQRHVVAQTLGRMPRAGTDLLHVLASLFATLHTSLYLQRNHPAVRTRRHTNYQALVREATKRLQQFQQRRTS